MVVLRLGVGFSLPSLVGGQSKASARPPGGAGLPSQYSPCLDDFEEPRLQN